MNRSDRTRRIKAARDAHVLAVTLRDMIAGYQQANRDVRTGHFRFVVTEELLETLTEFKAGDGALEK